MLTNYYYNNKELRKYIKETTDKSINKLIKYKEKKDEYKINMPSIYRKYSNCEYKSNIFLTMSVISLTSLVSYYLLYKK
jgi:hypothetical protein